MGLKKKLREKKNPEKIIFIDDDLTRSDQQIQATLRKMAKDLRSNGKDAKVEFERIKINGDYFYYNQEEQKLEPQRFWNNQNIDVERAGIAEKVKGTGGIPQ